jgi:hypothetical protein
MVEMGDVQIIIYVMSYTMFNYLYISFYLSSMCNYFLHLGSYSCLWTLHYNLLLSVQLCWDSVAEAMSPEQAM